MNKPSLKKLPIKLHKRVVRYGLVIGNLAIVTLAIFVVLRNSGGNTANYTAFSTAEEVEHADPLDVITARDVAGEIALMTSLPEADTILNEAAVARVKVASATNLEQSDTIQLPQIISANIKTKADIIRYKAKNGDTLSKLAEKFGVTSNSIRWSNGNLDTVQRGKTLLIPPVNGIVHKVSRGDTVSKLAGKYKASATGITRFNDAELTGLKRGELIVIPNGEIQIVQTNAFATGVVRRAFYSSNVTFVARYTDYAPYPIGGYGRGYCTDWASHRAAQLGNRVGNWGNANTWDDSARREHRYVGSTPKVGAVLQTNAGALGHVGVVEEVKRENGQWYIKFSDMNGLGGWGNAVKTNDWVPAAGYNYIY